MTAQPANVSAQPANAQSYSESIAMSSDNSEQHGQATKESAGVLSVLDDYKHAMTRNSRGYDFVSYCHQCQVLVQGVSFITCIFMDICKDPLTLS